MKSKHFEHPDNHCAPCWRVCLGLRLKEVADLAMSKRGPDGINGENNV